MLKDICQNKFKHRYFYLSQNVCHLPIIYKWMKLDQTKKKLIFVLFSEGFEWVGWSNDSVGSAGRPIELTFQFDTVRNFSAMVLHTNNMFSKSIQVSSFCFTLNLGG